MIPIFSLSRNVSLLRGSSALFAFDILESWKAQRVLYEMLYAFCTAPVCGETRVMHYAPRANVIQSGARQFTFL